MTGGITAIWGVIRDRRFFLNLETQKALMIRFGNPLKNKLYETRFNSHSPWAHQRCKY
jgi:hypothetical protein